MKIKPVKIISTILIILLCIIIIAVIAIGVFGDKAVKVAVETGASSVLKDGVTLEKASLGILAGKLTLKDLIVKNPPDYNHPNLITMGTTHVDVDIKSLLGDTVNIETMKLDSIDLFIEQKGLTNNLQEILDSLPKAKPDDKEPAEEKPAGKGKDLLIKELEISNVSVNVKFLPLPGRADTVKFDLEPIVMKDLGSKDKLSIAELTAKVLGALAVGVAKQGADHLPTEMLGPLQETLAEQGRMMLDAGKEVLDKTLDVSDKVLDTGKDITEGVGDALQGLFKDKK